MQDTCTVTRVTGSTFDTDDGTYTDTTSTVYSGKCRIQLADYQSAAESRTEGRVVTTVMHVLQLPAATTAVTVDDIATIATSEDAGLVGRTFRVKQVPNKTHLTMRRYIVEEEQT